MPVTAALAFVPVYIGLQKALGAHRPRHRAIELLDLTSDDVLIDVGCGPAYYFDRLPPGITYFGFDTDERYIAWSTDRFGSRGAFSVSEFDRATAADLPTPTAVALFGLLHHLPDDTAHDLLHLVADVIGPDGRVVTVDTCFHEDQGRLDARLSARDRGEHVRPVDEFVAMANDAFDTVDVELMTATPRMPTSHLLMTLR